ncbi:hypothetical protein DY000_02021049 [Brassica cretica]|uniref:Uncharacterized protein n=1 Tax=Brassica cretica TaxID=69181 RepID=A0ABQ7E228_BRACR|nr:hypothetical protein DY000_02021049 [Brassica cretica]
MTALAEKGIQLQVGSGCRIAMGRNGSTDRMFGYARRFGYGRRFGYDCRLVTTADLSTAAD